MFNFHLLSRKEKKWLYGLSCLLIVLVLITVLRNVSHANNPSRHEMSGQASVNTTLSGETKSTGQTTENVTLPLEIRELELDRTLPWIDEKTLLPFWSEQSCLDSVHLPERIPGQSNVTLASPLAGVTVILDPGHGGQDGGAVYPLNTGSPQYIEKDITLAVALKTQDALAGQGATVVLTRDKDEWVSLYRRIAWVSKYILERLEEELPAAGYKLSLLPELYSDLDSVIEINSDLGASGGLGPFRGGGVAFEQRLLMDIQSQFKDVIFLSLHCNSFPQDPSCSGLQVFYQTSEDVLRSERNAYLDPQERAHYLRYDDENRLRLADIIQQSVVSDIPELECFSDISVLAGNYAVLREINLNCVLIEMGFLSNEQDRQILSDSRYQQQLAESFTSGVIEYFKG